jgi:hypothetical protein
MFAPGSGQELKPRFIVSEDSLVIWFPIASIDGEWRWNVESEGTVERCWSASIESRSRQFCIRQRSEGGKPQTGTFADIAAASEQAYVLGERCHKAGSPTVRDGGLAWRTEAHFLFEPLLIWRPRTVRMLGWGSGVPDFDQDVVITYEEDPREERARRLDGPLTADEYAVYQTVIARLGHGRQGRLPVLTPSVPAGRWGAWAEGLVVWPGIDSSAVYNYVARADTVVDYSALAQLGYTVAAADSFRSALRSLPRGTFWPYLELSAIGFSDSGDHALVYCHRSCGGCGTGSDGYIILLKRIGGRWYIDRRIGVWSS